MQSKYVTWYGHHHLVLLISISKATSWSPSSPAWHLILHRSVIASRSSRQLLLLQLLLMHGDKVKQLHGACTSYNKETTPRLMSVVDITKHDHLIHQHISHHILTISHHNMPCKNKLDVLYFVVASFTWLLRASGKNRPYLRIKTTTVFHQVCCFNLLQGPGIVKLDSTKVGETDTRQPPVCEARR